LKSHLTGSFITSFEHLPKRIQQGARRDYQLWKHSPDHPSLQFKRVGRRREAYSVRVGIGWRALGVKEQDTMVWFWIGSHAEYDQILKRL
jgi:hypothetical protein